ncbi:MAG: DUF2283 domain-containing protein [Cyanobacteria bacterium CRU_2_1]|nr:DUF2283 domain-containing protein [Cyanobacteria bacterium CRU_2_1]
MDAVRILHNPADVSWDYDDEADVLYVSVGNPQPALGVDIGNGVILRYDETRNAVVGLTVIGLRAKLQEEQGYQATTNRSQSLIQAAKNIQALLEQLSADYPTDSPRVLGAKAIDQVEKDPQLKSRLLRGLKAGSFAALEKMIDHPVAKFFIEGAKEILEP